MTVLPVENVQDYPRPPRLERVHQPLRVIFAGVEIANADAGTAWRVLETHHAPTYYLPPDAVLSAVLVASQRETWCEWKGRAAYVDLVLNGRRARNAGWFYPAPTAQFEAIRDHIALYATSVDAAYVGEIRVLPQPGDFYGGWVTPNLIGKIKGAVGTTHW
ncbi:DUF427 domain-containing protein [Roseicyclus sp.]|uniref:DUF427 domain-containing protein n=1 Tax=Roseicyclus sp. TaxID=1914329 RepID=UPI003F6D7D7E